MKKIIFIPICLLISVFSFGQSILLEPGATKRFAVKSTGSIYGNFSTTSSAGADLIFRLSATGDGSSGTPIGYIQTFPDKFQIATNNYPLTFMTNDNERMRITSAGLLGIGTSAPASNLHLHQPTASVGANYQITNADAGNTINDGLHIGLNPSSIIFSYAASIMNKENSYLFLGTNNTSHVAISEIGKVGIGNLVPNGKLDVAHNTTNIANNPHLNLRTTADASNGMIRMENSAGTRYFGQYFNLNSATPANNFVSFDYNGTTPILDMQGNGNVQISGFTRLGNDATTPRIKMKTITLSTASTEGGDTFTAHGLTVAKIISYDALVDTGGGVYVKEGISTTTGFNAEREFSTEINSVNLRVYNHPTNSGNILSKTVKVVITYTE